MAEKTERRMTASRGKLPGKIFQQPGLLFRQP